MADLTMTYDAAGGPAPPALSATRDERTYALLIHLSTFLFPLTGPLVLWLIRRHDSPFIDDHGKEAVNFHITLIGAAIALAVLSFVTFGIGMVFTVPAALVISVLDVVWTIQAAMRANDGARWRYPCSVRLVG